MCVRKTQRKHSGFSLIEMVVGISVLAIAMTAVTALVAPQATQSTDPIYQVRAAELGQSLLNEIMAKSFDEASNPSGGLVRCGEGGTTCSTTLGPDTGETDPDAFDDVDDYHGYTSSAELLDSTSTYASLYTGYTFTVSVIYDGDYNGTADAIRVAKRVDIAVTTPDLQVFRFAGYRGNY